MTPSAKRLLLACSIALLALPAWALQIIPVREGVTAFAKIASDDLTRIAIEGGRIQSWYTLKGRLIIEKDARTGQIYIRPLERGDPVSIFITADSGATYALTLQPVDMPAESLILQEQTKRGSRPSAVERAPSHIEMVKQLALMMASGRIPSDMEVIEHGEEVRLWRDTHFVLLRSWSGSTVVGDLYRLTNTGAGEMRVAEQEFYRPGVLSVGVENHVLRSGDSTRVFVIRIREGVE